MENTSRSIEMVARSGSQPLDSASRDVDWHAVRTTLDHIGGKWTLSIIEHLLLDGPHRFSELEARLDPIASTALSSNLEALQEKDLVEREVLDTKPVHVEYDLTERGRSLEPVMDSLVAWGKENICTKKIIENKHHPSIIHLLLVNKSLYFNGLKQRLDITNKMLSESLERLQEYDIVRRTVEDTKPVQVKYSLTDRGESLVPVLGALSNWSPDDAAAALG